MFSFNPMTISLISFDVNEKENTELLTHQVYSNSQTYNFKIKFTLNSDLVNNQEILETIRPLFSFFETCFISDTSHYCKKLTSNFWEKYRPVLKIEYSTVSLLFLDIVFKDLPYQSNSSYSLKFDDETLIQNFVIIDETHYSQLRNERTSLLILTSLQERFKFVPWMQICLKNKMYSSCFPISTKEADLTDLHASIPNDSLTLFKNKQYSLKLSQTSFIRVKYDYINTIFYCNEPFEFNLRLEVSSGSNKELEKDEILKIANFIKLRESIESANFQDENHYHFNYFYEFSQRKKILQLSYLVRFTQDQAYKQNGLFRRYEICFNNKPLTLPFIVIEKWEPTYYTLPHLSHICQLNSSSIENSSSSSVESIHSNDQFDALSDFQKESEISEGENFRDNTQSHEEKDQMDACDQIISEFFGNGNGIF